MWESLDAEWKRKKGRLDAFFSNQNDFRSYRSATRRGPLPCVPILGRREEEGEGESEKEGIDKAMLGEISNYVLNFASHTRSFVCVCVCASVICVCSTVVHMCVCVRRSDDKRPQFPRE